VLGDDLIRRWVVVLHRYSGLAMSAFLVIAGLTGTLLAFNTELERAFAPQLFAAPRPKVPRLDLPTLAVRAQEILPHARVRGVVYVEPDHVQVYFSPEVDPSTGQPYELGFTELFLDPWTGRELGHRNRGDLREGVVNLMPFIYLAHYTLVGGETGQLVFGIVAILWTIDCFVGFYLTLPRGTAAFWRRWGPAWLVKLRSSGFRLTFDLHRAGGLWVWALLFVFAWSSVMMNIRPAYEAVTERVFDYQSPNSEPLPLDLPEPRDHPRLDWQAGAGAGKQLMEAQALAHHFTVEEPLGLSYDPASGTYTYEVRSSRDVFRRSPKGGSTSVTLDGNTGAFITLFTPTGSRTGNTIESWLYALHMARVFGRPYQVFVAVLGLVVAMLATTGVLIWWRKRAGRRTSATRRRQLRSQPREALP
jgi:uncharacterized iron-regulated membrane protein